MANVSLRAIAKQYPGAARQTLRGIDLEIEDGEFLVLVGPSGCGKSTLLRILAGLESITSGELRIGDRVVNAVPPKDRDIAMVFQSYALYPHMTVRRNMAFGLEVRKTPRAEIDRLVEEAAQMLGLVDQLDKLPRAMSGGQRQRVAMGRAIVRRPQVFLFDEPLSNLDAALRAQMRVEIMQLHARLATTTVYVTHDQVEAMTLADRIAVLDRGVLQQVGAPMELFDRPANRFVAGFIGSPAMNFLAGTLVAAASGQQGWSVRLAGEAGELRFVADADALEPGALLVGVRPQDVALGAATAEDAGALTATVRLVETLGWESHVHLSIGESRLLAVVEAHEALALRPGASVQVRLPARALHLFDAASERALLHAPRAVGAGAASVVSGGEVEPSTADVELGS